MAGLEDAGNIDLIGADANGAGILYMFEERPWSDDARQQIELRAKIECYWTFVTTGQLVEMYPELQDKPVTIQLNCAGDPPTLIRSLLDVAARALERDGLSLVVRVTSQRR